MSVFYKLFLRDSEANNSCWALLRSISLFSPLKFVIKVFFDEVSKDPLVELVIVVLVFFSEEEFVEQL